MSTRWRGIILAAGLVTGVYACADREGPESPAGPETVRADGPRGSTCDTRGVSSDARSYFSLPEARTARDLIGAMGTACTGGESEAREELAWQVLALVETALENGRGGDPVVGASLVNGLVDCIDRICEPLPGNELQVVGALGTHGIFAVRFGGTAAAIAREPVSFVFDGVSNRALWGVEVDSGSSWDVVTGTDPVLFYGAPRGVGGAPVLDRGIGSVQYDLNRYPIPGTGRPGNPFVGDDLHVGVCFETEVTLPHEDGDESKPAMAPRMQREAVLLQFHTPEFCGDAFPTVRSASVLGTTFAAIGRLLPSAWRAAFFSDRKAPSLGGTPLNFSDFVAVAAETQGSLVFVSQPNSVVVQNASIGEVRVQARSGAGTPMEMVEVTLSIRANMGVPAGAVLVGDNVASTDEEEGIATFTSELAIGKAGGYLLCANGKLDGFAFPEVCSDQIHVRNATGG